MGDITKGIVEHGRRINICRKLQIVGSCSYVTLYWDVILTRPPSILSTVTQPHQTSRLDWAGLGWAGRAAPLFELLLNARLASAAAAVVAVPLGCAEVQESEYEHVNTEHRKPRRSGGARGWARLGAQGPSSLTRRHTAACNRTL